MKSYAAEGSSHLCNVSLKIKNLSHWPTDVEMGAKTLEDEWRKEGSAGGGGDRGRWTTHRVDVKQEQGGNGSDL